LSFTEREYFINDVINLGEQSRLGFWYYLDSVRCVVYQVHEYIWSEQQLPGIVRGNSYK
jgi:hypothetical protein